MDVGDWLLSIGLSQYEALFRESEIDAEVLSELSEVDFEKIGIPLGHRKRLLKAIANLDASRSASTQPSTAPAPLPIPAFATTQFHPIRRTPALDRDVLRPRRLDQHLRQARRRGLA